MTGKNRQAGGFRKAFVLGVAAIAAMLTAMSCGWAAPGYFGPRSLTAPFEPETIWEILVGAFILVSFMGAVILWVMSALRQVKRALLKRSALVNAALNNLTQGVVMTNAQNRVVFCNDRYLEIYGLERADVAGKMTRQKLLDPRRDRGSLDLTSEQFYSQASAPDGHTLELADGRAIVVKFRRLANGGSVTTHEECTEQRRLSRQLATTKQFLESVIDNIPTCVAVKDIESGVYVLTNRAAERLLRLPRERIVGRRPEDIYSAETAAQISAADEKALKIPEGRVREEMIADRGRRKRIIDNYRVVVRNDAGEPEFVVTLFEDITEQRSLARELETAKRFLDLVVDNIPVALTVEDIHDGRYLLANRSAETILNRRREDATGLTANDIFNPKEAKLIVGRDQAAIRKRGMMTEEHPISTKDGLRLFQTRRVTVLDDAGEPKYLIKTHEDVTDRRQTESRMAHMAYHDGLTDLPNRLAFNQALSQMIEACEDSGEQFAVLSIDLNRLKEVNDVFGHTTGDGLLVAVSRRIQQAARGGVVARLGGDEFGLIIDGPQPESAAALAERIRDAMASDFQIDGKSVRTTVTTGISLYPRDGTNAAQLLANADAALFRTKARSRGSIGIFEPEMDQQIRDRRVLHQDLSAAIHNGELSLHYQPQARLGAIGARFEIAGFEALVRWMHPTRGMVSPAEFIPLAEESGMIVEMGEWILREACREAASWPQPLQVAVNLSPAQFVHGDLVGLVHCILIETGLDPDRLELEITEGVLIDDFDRGVALLRRLKALGVRISMDDFGSGYSSLTYLQSFPFEKVKIDRAFIMNLGRNPQSAAIVRAMIGLCHGLGILTVAEGVETEQQLDFLVREACDIVQGFYIGRPAPIGQYFALIGDFAHDGSSAAGKAAESR